MTNYTFMDSGEKRTKVGYLALSRARVKDCGRAFSCFSEHSTARHHKVPNQVAKIMTEIEGTAMEQGKQILLRAKRMIQR